jgi:hypothetical protein
MTTTFKVRFWEIADWTKSKDKKKKKGRPYGVRWVTEHKPHSEWYSKGAGKQPASPAHASSAGR